MCKEGEGWHHCTTARYLDGDDWPAGLYQATLDGGGTGWQRRRFGARREVFTIVRSNAVRNTNWCINSAH